MVRIFHVSHTSLSNVNTKDQHVGRGHLEQKVYAYICDNSLLTKNTADGE